MRIASPRLALLLGALVLTGGCAGLREALRLGHWDLSGPAPEIDPEVYQRAEIERSEFFEREVERLRADLQQAEESIVALESGLRGFHTRADAVSALAEARIALDRVAHSVPWRADRVREANAKLDEASRQLEAGHVGAAVFFASRAQRITDSLRAEAHQVALWNERLLVRAEHANLRVGPATSHHVLEVLPHQTPVFPERTLEGWMLVRTPSGRIGWVYSALLSEP